MDMCVCIQFTMQIGGMSVSSDACIAESVAKAQQQVSTRAHASHAHARARTRARTRTHALTHAHAQAQLAAGGGTATAGGFTTLTSIMQVPLAVSTREYPCGYSQYPCE